MNKMIEVFNEVVTKGEVYELGHPHHKEIPHHPSHHPFLYSMARMHGDLTYKTGNTSANDLFTMGSHTGTHIDALGHVACNGFMYNSIATEGNQSKTEGLSVHGVEEISPIIKKAVLLDIAELKGVECLEPGYKIHSSDLIQAARKQSITIKKGDAVFIRTGWSKYINNPNKYISTKDGTPGVSTDGAEYLINLEVNLTGSDTAGFEVMPTESLPVHKLLLVDNGINIIEVMNLEEISKNKIYDFLFICLPLRIIGSTASPIRPIAIC